jgi:hypothetical protein
MPSVADVQTIAKAALQTCDQAKVLEGLTEAVRLMEEKGHFDFSISTIDISVCDACITLPSFVGTVLAVNTCAGPNYLRDNWYQFHANSVGSEKWTDCGYADELGSVCTFRDVEAPSRLVAIVEDPRDNNKQIRVFGYKKDGVRIYTAGANNVLEDGLLVPIQTPLSPTQSSVFTKMIHLGLFGLLRSTKPENRCSSVITSRRKSTRSTVVCVLAVVRVGLGSNSSALVVSTEI